MPTYHVSLAFAGLPDAALVDFTGTVIAGLTNNAAFPEPPVTLNELTAAQAIFAHALAAMPLGGPQTTAAKNVARASLLGLLRRTAYYVQGAMENDLELLLSSGYAPTNSNRTQAPLAAPVVLKVMNEQSTQLVVQLKPVPNAKAYEVRKLNGTGGWLLAGVFTKARRIVIEDLVPGSTYSFQARAVGGSTGYSGWSDPVQHMAT